MATGSGPLGRNLPEAGTSNLTPTYEVPNQARLYEQMGDALARLSEPVQNALERRAARAGRKAGMEAAAKVAADVEAGKAPAAVKRPRTDILTHGAYASAFNAAALAKIKGDLDNHDEVLRGQFKYDPQGYREAAAKALSGFIQGSPEEMAVEVESYGQTKFADSYSAISRVAEERAGQEAAADLSARIKGLDEKLLGLASRGLVGSDEFSRVDGERAILQIEREQNPAIIYSPTQRAQDDDALYDELHGASAAYSATQAYGEAGGGQPGLTAAKRYLKAEILDSEAFADMSPKRRERIYGDAKRSIEAFAEADIEQERVEQAAEREARAAERETVGELRLQIALGGMTEGAINARDDISDAYKASLIAGVRAQKRREQSDARTAAAAVRAGQVAAYGQFRDMADAGTLTAEEIADARTSGILTPGQARTLAARRDKSLGPVVADVMAPVKDAGDRAGRANSAEKLAIAEEQAVEWARKNPNASLDDKLKFGRALAERVYGAPKSTPGPVANDPRTKAAAKAAKFAALKKQRETGQIDQATYMARLTELTNAH